MWNLWLPRQAQLSIAPLTLQWWGLWTTVAALEHGQTAVLYQEKIQGFHGCFCCHLPDPLSYDQCCHCCWGLIGVCSDCNFSPTPPLPQKPGSCQSASCFFEAIITKTKCASNCGCASNSWSSSRFYFSHGHFRHHIHLWMIPLLLWQSLNLLWPPLITLPECLCSSSTVLN